MMPGLISGLGLAQARERAMELLESVGLGRWAEHRPGELSGGEQQRVAVVRALMNSPRLLLADEPSGNLDRDSAHDLHRLLDDLRREQGVSLVIVTHDLELAKAGRSGAPARRRGRGPDRALDRPLVGAPARARRAGAGGAARRGPGRGLAAATGGGGS